MSTTLQDDGILYLCGEEIKAICAQIDSVDIMREVFAMHATGQTVLPDEAYLGWTNGHDEPVRNLNMPGYLGGSLQTAGTKIINSNIANPKRGLTRASGITILYDITTTRILCIMEAAYISSLRTASVSVLAAELLKGREIEHVAVIGAGVLAQAHIELMAKRWPHLQQISLFDLDQKRIQMHTIEHLLTSRNIELHITGSAEEAIRPAQLVIPVTTTTSGYIPYSWLQVGSVLVNVSLDDILPDVIFNAHKVVVDDWQLVKNDKHRLLGNMYRAGQVVGPGEPAADGQRRVDAQLGEIVTMRKAGREQATGVIVVNPFGLAIEDVALATYVYHAALERGDGIVLPR